MTESELFAHYEKIYFYEQSRKEQIFSRLNIPLAVKVALVGFYAVIISSDYKALSLGGSIWMWVVLAFSVAALIVGSYFFVDSLLGRMDKAVATPNALENWRQSLILYYGDEVACMDIVAAEIRRALYIDYMNCASILTVNNDRKSSSLYYCNVALIVSAAFAAIAYAIVKIPNL
ncbi:TPA: hypothetical protein SAN82_001028 [Pseudomonas putida]|nr:hypothetical protein [Pseudomonas putida]